MASATEEGYLDALCKQLYESQNAEERAAAERALAQFSERNDCLQKCMMLLENGTNSYSQLLACTTLTKLISRNSMPVVALEERIELRNYLVNYLVSRPKMPTFVVNSLCQLFARLTKLGWFDFTKGSEYVFRSSVEEIHKLAQGSVELCILAVQLLSHLVAEMNQPAALGSITKHRKVAASFRDVQLFEIFQLSVQMLQTALDNIKNIDDQLQVLCENLHNYRLSDKKPDSTVCSYNLNLISGLLQLAINCLTFDFIGSLIDDTSDDNVNVQVPTAWRVAFTDGSIVQLFFGLYGVLPSELSAKALTCLVQLASIRRTIFNNTERQQFLTALVVGTKSVFENSQRLTDQNTYHEFCRLVARLKSNYQLSELIRVEDYPKVLRMLAEFTVTSLQMYQFAANSIHYLLSFWQRMVSSMPYVKASEPHLLEEFAPLVTKAYIESRLAMVQNVLRDGLEDPLEDPSSLSQQMEQISVIGRCEYERTCGLLMQLFDNSASAYQQALINNIQWDTKLQQGRLTWLVYIIGASIGGRVAFSTSEEHDLIDGDLICRVMQLQRLSDDRLAEGGCEKMEFAFLWHLEQFRKIYISDQVQKTSKVYNKLSENLGLNDEAAVLAVFVRKIITNLKFWSAKERLIDETLTLLNDLSIGYSSVRKLVRLPEIQFLLNNHTSEHFSFLGTGSDLKVMKSRSTFYTALTRLLCIELGDDEEVFDRFMAPLTSAMNELSNVFSMADSAIAGQVEAKRAVIGLCRDIRGVAYASNTKTAYAMLFDWIYPNYMAILLRALEIWYADPELSTPILKLICELCQNRSQRLQFDVSSPNAILLFKEASKLICAYGSRILPLQESIPKEHSYRLLFKGIGVCLGILKAALSGAYVNFGVFRLYGDDSLDNVLNMFIKMLLAIPQNDLLAYSKLSHNYYYVLECLAQDHLAFLSNLEPQIFAYMLQTLQDGLTALDTMVCTGVCSTLDHIITYLYKRVSRGGKSSRAHAGMPPEGDNCIRTIEQRPEILTQMLSSILNTVMFEECRCQWSMSRPLLGLIMLQEEAFSQLKSQMVSAQPAANQAAFDQCFATLMDSVERNLSLKNKDRFTHNLSVFRREIAECLKGSSAAQALGYDTSMMS